MQKLKILLLFFICSTNAWYSQKATTENILFDPNFIAVKFYGAPTFPIGVAYGQMINDRVSMEIGIGFLSIGSGIELFLTNPRKHKLNLNTGVFGSYNFDGFPMVYFPLGVSYLGKKNFQYNINVGALYSKDVRLVRKDFNFWPWFGLSVGARFGKDNSTQYNLEATEPIETIITDKIDTIKLSEKKSNASNIISARIGFLNPLIGINYERLITPKIEIETTVGFLGASLGAHVYFTGLKPKQLNFKMGITNGIFILDKVIDFSYFTIYVPVGFNYLSENNITSL